MGSHYLWKPPRTLRTACRNLAAIYPELTTGDCSACANGRLCAIYERIERGQAGAAEAACLNTSCSLEPITLTKIGA
jgi:hypothetical protein